MRLKCGLLMLTLVACCGLTHGEPSEEQLAKWLKRFPEADANKDGRLTDPIFHPRCRPD